MFIFYQLRHKKLSLGIKRFNDKVKGASGLFRVDSAGRIHQEFVIPGDTLA
jgi:hypothetical protein